ncbi:MAG: histidine phosphatase family protein [Candidatus Yanofskybacteria bacterium]|nr:histidine phosphatase family protein [Candidatus Yanofskybacteria bacterium]
MISKRRLWFPALREREQGVLVGVHRDEIYRGDNGRFITYQGPWFRPSGGESQKMVQRRVSAWLEEEILLNESFLQSERTLHFAIFGSGMNFKCLFMDIAGFDSSLLWKIEVNNCSISRFRFTIRGWFVECINDTGHLLGLI